MLRPRPCRWFDLITTRDDVAQVLESLARACAVELETHERWALPLVIAGAGPALERYHELAKSFRSHWPLPRTAAVARVDDPARMLEARVALVEAWRAQAEPLIAESERLAGQLKSLADLGQVLEAGSASLPDPGLLAAAGQFMLESRIYAVATRDASADLPASLLAQRVRGADEDFLVIVGRKDDMPMLDSHFAARKARRIALPNDLQGPADQAAQQLAGRRQDIERRHAQIERELQGLSDRQGLAAALADIEVIEWLVRHGSELSASDRLARVTGWTTATDTQAFCDPLERAGLRCAVQFPDVPAGSEPPSLLDNPPWARASEGFARMLGQPGRDEADPSPMVALIGPLLFGFMFGDVGQGAVLCAAGWLLRKRAPMLVLLIPGGLLAMAFGLLFGTVFAREDLIPALWLHPLHEPIALLVAAVGIGAMILLGGLALNALQAHWRHAARQWWARDAGIVLAYVALLAGVAQRDALWFVGAGALWFALGSMLTATGNRLAALGAGLAQFVEQGLQLLVNTVSFARVGAFALAHAGLSVAVTGVAEAAGSMGYWIVLLLGNVLILALEGLVVSIQTTRLLLFEFFVRFLKGTGREFRPLPPPLVHHLQTIGARNQ